MLKVAGLTGKSEIKIDSKGRVGIPAAFRKTIAPGDADDVVVVLAPNKNLLIFNKDYWEGTIQQGIIDKGNVIGKEKMWRVIYKISENSHSSTVDNQGRITIPSWLLEKACIKKDAIVIGAFDRVSVWDPDIYEKWMGEMDIESAVADVGLY